MDALTQKELDILATEAAHPNWRPGEREGEARTRWRLTPTRYAQILNRLIDTEAALAHDPHTVNRLRRTRDRFTKSRTRRRTA